MVARVLSIIRGADAGAPRSADPALDVNAYAVADDVELTIVLKDHGVELALAETRCQPEHVAGVEIPAATPSTDLRALLGSGVRVLAVREDVERRGLHPDELVDGVELVDGAELAVLIVEHDRTLATTS